MRTVTAQELLALDKKRFDKEYWKWVEYATHYDWWDCEYEAFKERCEGMRIDVEDISFSGFCSQGDGAAFSGRIYLAALMERRGLDVTFPALYIGVLDDGSYSRVEKTNHNCMRSGAYENYANRTAPGGIFSDLDQGAWESLIDDEEAAAGLEDLALEEADTLANELYDTLESRYESITSRKEFIESCAANDITFDVEAEEGETP
jgi:hypothetical protein